VPLGLIEGFDEKAVRNIAAAGPRTTRNRTDEINLGIKLDKVTLAGLRLDVKQPMLIVTARGHEDVEGIVDVFV
jgi:hypothetical protein